MGYREKLRFERMASTADVRICGDFGIIPSSHDVEWKMGNKNVASVYGRSASENSGAMRCETILPCDRKRCTIKMIFVAGGRRVMASSYNKL